MNRLLSFSRVEGFFFNFTGPNWGIRMLLTFSIMALTVIGIVFVNSTSGGAEDQLLLTKEAMSQLIKAGVGIGALVFMLALDYQRIERLSYFLYFFLLAVLACLLTLRQVAGVNRWIEVGFFNIQPSELMKITLVITLASFLKFRHDQSSFRGFIKPFLWTAGPMFLVIAQPDLGTSLMLPPILLSMLIISGARWKHLLTVILAGACLLPGMLLIHYSLPEDLSKKIVKNYQIKRISSYLGAADEEELRTSAFQYRQSKAAISAGGLMGQGYGQGQRNKLNLLPARQTDFIFSIIAEEWGFIGAMGVLTLYLILVGSCFYIAMESREPFARLVACGIGTLFAAQGFQNLGMTMGITPITGLPLPFVSFGGSSLVTSFLAAGLVLGIAFQPRRVFASRDLQPRNYRSPVALIDDHAQGANRIVNGP